MYLVGCPLEQRVVRFHGRLDLHKYYCQQPYNEIYIPGSTKEGDKIDSLRKPVNTYWYGRLRMLNAFSLRKIPVPLYEML